MKSVDDEKMILLNDINNTEISVDIKVTNHFKPMYAMTVHKAQGMTINKPYSIYEYDRMKHDMLYVIFINIHIWVNHISVQQQILKNYV